MPLLFMEADIDEVGPIIRLTSSNVLPFTETPFFGEGEKSSADRKTKCSITICERLS